MDLIRENGFEYLGDDFVILYKNKVLSFPAVFQEFNFRINYLPTEELRKERYFQDLILWFNFIRKKKDYKNTFFKVSKSSKVNSIFFIERSNINKFSIRKIKKLDYTIKKLLFNTELERLIISLNAGLVIGGPYKYFLMYSLAFPRSNLASYEKKLTENYKKTFTGISSYEFDIPLKYDKKIFRRIIKFIKG